MRITSTSLLCTRYFKCDNSQLTTQDLFADLESIQNGCGDPSHGADHASQAQVNQHEEEHDRPEGTGRKMRHSLREGDECQTGALHRLKEREAGVKSVRM